MLALQACIWDACTIEWGLIHREKSPHARNTLLTAPFTKMRESRKRALGITEQVELQVACM
jgi:hypothetical protein